MTLNELKKACSAGDIDTVLVCLVDMQGRLIGKRFHAKFFMDSGFAETHACDYLLADDITMEPVAGYKAASWDKGYGDFVLKPDMSTLRRIPWLEGTALVLCDVLDHHTHADLAHSPRAILRQQIKRIESLGMQAFMASELEFYLFDETYDSARQKSYSNLTTTGHYIEDYHIFQTSKEEGVMRSIRNGLEDAGIPVESSKGEWGPGQEEINVRYTDALQMADRHAILKNGCKEIAWQNGKAITFMAKWSTENAGSSSHIHQSLWNLTGKQPLFLDKDADHGMSELMQHYMAGQLAYAREITWYLAPYINSYKRFHAGTLPRQRRSGVATIAPPGFGSVASQATRSVSSAVLAVQISTLTWRLPHCWPRESRVSKTKRRWKQASWAMRTTVNSCAKFRKHCARLLRPCASQKCCAQHWVMK
jgi:glutamine synthetase